MKTHFSCLWIAASFLFLPQAGRAQQDNTDLFRLHEFVDHIRTVSRLLPQEKVYLHFDNTGYFLGETIWFKAYVTSAGTLQSDPPSHVLYVELLNAEGYVVRTCKLPIQNGQAAGQIPLTGENMKSGFYEVRAYTRLQLNYDRETLFSRVFPIFDTPSQEGLYSEQRISPPHHKGQIPLMRESDYAVQTDLYRDTAKWETLFSQIKREIREQQVVPTTIEKRDRVSLEFYPEGGRLLRGIPCRTAFKATNQWGQNLQIAGVVCTAKGDTVSAFATRHLGMGELIYTPSDENTYARFRHDGKEYKIPLPRPDSTGCALRLKDLRNGQWELTLQRPDTSAYHGLLGLTIQCRGQLQRFQTFAFASGKLSHQMLLSAQRLPSGVQQITVFTPTGEILAERMAFVDQGEEIRFAVSRDRKFYNPLDSIGLQFHLTDVRGRGVETTFSLAVRDADTEIPTTYAQNARSNLLLCSDLKGFIEQPDYYFKSKDTLRRQHLDLLLLTQGYRRYAWKQMAGIKPFEAKHRVERYLLLDGSVHSLVRKKKEENISINMNLLTDDDRQMTGSCTTDSLGNFSIRLQDFYGKGELQLESRNAKGKRTEKWITLNRLFTPRGRKLTWYDTFIPDMKVEPMEAYLEMEKILKEPTREELKELEKEGTMLDEHSVTAHRRWEGFVTRNASIIYDIAEEEDRMEDAMKGYNEDLGYFLYRTNRYYNDGRYKGRKVIWYYVDVLPPDSVTGEQRYMHMGSLSNNEQAGFSWWMEKGFISTEDVESIAIVENTSLIYSLAPEVTIGGGFKGNEVLIYVKLNRFRHKREEPVGMRLTSFQGFSKPQAFFSPDYSQIALPDEQDYRRTLYWNPNVRTSPSGKANVRFFNNSTCRRLSINAEAVTSDGVAGSFAD